MERDLKCMYCAEAGITNTDVFIEIVDVELGAGWICKECFIESEKEKDEHLKELEQQLKRKEQESETLASQLDFEVQKKECLEQECEELKKDVIEALKLVEITSTHNTFQESRINKLSKTLTEIKEIAEILAPMTDEYENCLDRDRCFECDFTEDCQYFNIKQILQKISEVEDETINN